MIAIGLAVVATGCHQRQSATNEDIVATRRENACTGTDAEDSTLPFDSKIYRSDTGLISDEYWSPRPEKVGDRFVLVPSLDSARKKLEFDKIDSKDHTDAQTFIENTEFDAQVLLVWDVLLPVGYELEVSSVTLPEKDLLHAYVCSYDGTGPNETRAAASYLYNILLRVAVPTPPASAKLTYSTENENHERNSK